MSVLLKGAVYGCRMRPALGSAFKFSKMPLSYVRVDSLGGGNERRWTTTLNTPAPKLSQIARCFTTSSPTKMSSGIHDHSKLWTYEKALSLGLLFICPLDIMYPNVLFDIIVAVSAVMHMHWGVEAIAVDYVRPVIFGNLITKIAHVLVYVLSIFTLVGLLNLTFNNSGIGNGIRLLWKI